MQPSLNHRIAITSLVLCALAAAEEGKLEDNVLPLGEGGKALNLDFETGNLKDWTIEGDAFKGQPIKGDTVTTRGRGQASKHQGDYWIGGYEKLKDGPQGTLTSNAFTVTHPFASFRIAGGPQATTRVDVLLADSGKVIFSSSGQTHESLRRVAFDLQSHKGKKIFIRIVDKSSGPWGHINFDDFRFNAKKPKTPPRAPAQVASLPLTAEEAAKKMTLPEGFSVTVSASEPDVRQPIAMAFDHKGRLWVAEALAYPRRRGKNQSPDRILIFEDKDGNGTFDERIVFTEGLNLVSGIEVGFGGVFVGAAPYLLFIPDRDGDDKPDGEPEILLDGWGYQDTHETLNSFIWGPDGWLYGCHGVFTRSNVGKPGTPVNERASFNCAVWRYQPVRSEFEVFAHGGSNQWGIDFDDRGQAFMTTCRSRNGGGPVTHVIQGGYYWRQSGGHRYPHAYSPLKASADTGHGPGGAGGDRATYGGHAHCGAMIYLGDNWPEKYRNLLMTNNVHGHRVNVEKIHRRGSGYRIEHMPNLLFAHDQRFMGVNLRYGPDGGVFVLDWYDRQNCHTNNISAWDRGSGRIYKVTYGERSTNPQAEDPSTASDSKLVELQLHQNDWYVRHARRALQERAAAGKLSAEVRPALSKILDENPDITRKLRALWALHVTGGIEEELTLKLLQHPDEFVRSWSIQLELEDSEVSDAVAGRLVEMAGADSSQPVRLYLASALQRLPADARWPIAEGLASHETDSADRNIPQMLWLGMEPLVAKDPSKAIPLAASSKIPLVRESAARRAASTGSRKAVDAVVDALADAEGAAASDLLRGFAKGFAGRRKFQMPAGWPEVYRRLTGNGSESIGRAARQLALLFDDQQVLADLRKIAEDTKQPIAERSFALKALLAKKDPDLAPVLQKLVADESLRPMALRGLTAYSDPKTPSVILSAYPQLDASSKRVAIGALTSRPAYASALLDAVAKGRVPRTDLSVFTVRKIGQMPGLKDKLVSAWGTVRPVSKPDLIRKYQAMLQPKSIAQSDPVQGRLAFDKICANCHTLHGAGADIGPDLTGSDRTNLSYLIENIIDPNALVGRDFQLTTILTKEEQILSGIVRKQTGNAVTLRTTNEEVVVPREEIDRIKTEDSSMMPEGLLDPLKPLEVKDLFAYLASPEQIPRFGEQKRIFDGKTFEGWEGNLKWFRIEDEAIVGGHMTGPIPRNEFLCTEQEYTDFDLRLKVRLKGRGANSGIQIRTRRIPNHHEVIGYQADVGRGWWGKLYDESRRGRVLAQPNAKEFAKFLKPDDWNDYRVVCYGRHLLIWVNGYKTVSFQEPDPKVWRKGIIGVQIHGSRNPSEAWFKDITIAVPEKK
ncbi:MAG: DUF1080 domain-containing protein [Planctomycetota bacterium]|nr:DUF1080 domain-containing protein [Planctomycetota bacterium]